MLTKVRVGELRVGDTFIYHSDSYTITETNPRKVMCGVYFFDPETLVTKTKFFAAKLCDLSYGIDFFWCGAKYTLLQPTPEHDYPVVRGGVITHVESGALEVCVDSEKYPRISDLEDGSFFAFDGVTYKKLPSVETLYMRVKNREGVEDILRKDLVVIKADGFEPVKAVKPDITYTKALVYGDLIPGQAYITNPSVEKPFIYIKLTNGKAICLSDCTPVDDLSQDKRVWLANVTFKADITIPMGELVERGKVF